MAAPKGDLYFRIWDRIYAYTPTPHFWGREYFTNQPDL